MSEAKTKPAGASVDEFLAAVSDDRKREDNIQVCKMMTEITDEQSQMWGPSIVGFGSYHYVCATGHSGDAPLTGFSPRKANLTLYIMLGFDGYDALMAKLGKHTTSKSCLYIKRLSDVDQDVLGELIGQSSQRIKAMYSPTYPAEGHVAHFVSRSSG